MNVQASWFQEGGTYAKIPRSERNGKPWKYRLLSDVAFRFEKKICFGEYYCLDADGNCWGSFHPHKIIVRAPYHWNGSSCSPDWKVLLASLPHDLLYQFSSVAGFPFSRHWCDNLFFSLAESPLRSFYWLGLTLGGWTCWGQRKPGDHILT